MNGKIPLSDKIYSKLASALELSQIEREHIDLLRQWKLGESADKRLSALKQLYRMPAFRRIYKNQIESSQYLTHWLHIAIRELATIPGFKLDAHWIREKLTFQASTEQVKSSLKFLTEHGLIEESATGKVRVANRDLACEGELFLFSMSAYHRQMLDLAKQALQDIPSNERIIEGVTLSLTAEDTEALRVEWNRLAEKAMRLSSVSTGKNQKVFQMEFSLFPLSKNLTPEISPQMENME